MGLMGVDVGGTFTDVVAFRDGRLSVAKVPSIPGNPQQAVIEGARRLGLGGIDFFNHASTKGLNAVLTRQLPKIGFLTTDGHRDMLDAGRAWRPFAEQLDARWHRPFGDAARPLVPRYLRRGVRERALASGEILLPLDEAQALEQLQLLKRCGIQGLAICLINAYINPQHEQRLAVLARQVLGDVPLSISSDTSPRAKEFARASTTVIDVMMKLLYAGYAQDLDQGLLALGFQGNLHFADCTAALLPWRGALEHPHRILFAGPAAGTASCLQLGRVLGEGALICCDVGGTSTDVSLIVGGQCFTNDGFEIEHDLTVSALSTEVSSVGAGGGSIVAVSESGDIQVGPQSAGAMPGPACYGRGGQRPTVTDACVLMGIVSPDSFADGQIHLDVQAARAAFLALDTPLSLEERVNAAFRIAVNNIAEEITNQTIRRGADLRDFSLVAFGAAGPMLLPHLNERLPLKRVIVPPNPGLFSALGLISTDLVRAESQSAYLPLEPASAGQLNQIYARMEATLRAQLGAAADSVSWARSFDGRLVGQSWETPFIDVPAGPIGAEAVAEMVRRFHVEYERRNGQHFRNHPVQGVTYRVRCTQPVEKFAFVPAIDQRQAFPAPLGWRALQCLGAAPVRTALFERAALHPGAEILGPAIVQEPLSTTFVPAGQRGRIGPVGEILIERIGERV